MKKITYLTINFILLTTLTTLPAADWGVGGGVGGYGGGVGFGVSDSSGYPAYGPGPSYNGKVRDQKGRDYWRIDNAAPFPITVQSDKETKTLAPGQTMVRLHRRYNFGFMVLGSGKQNNLGSTAHNLAIGIDQLGNLQMLNQWNQ
jgi:hypothetical protein